MKSLIAMYSPDHHCTYEVPVAMIAMLRHMQLHGEMMLETPHPDQDAITRQVATEFEDDAKVQSFAATLRWADIVSHARLVEWGSRPPNPMTSLWSDPYDEPKVAAMPADNNMSGAPLDLYLSLLWQQNSRIVVDLMTNQGEVTGAMILVTGNQEEIQAYMAVVAQLSEQIAKQPDGAPPPPRRPYRH